MKKATHEVRKRQSEIVAVVEQGLESVRSVKAFGRQDMEEARLNEASQATVQAALKARRVKSLLSPIVSVTVAFCAAFVLWRGAGLILSDAMTVGALTVFLAYLNKFFKPVQDLAKMTNIIAQAAVGLERVQTILDADTIIPEKPDARDRAKSRARSCSSTSPSPTTRPRRCCATSTSRSSPGSASASAARPAAANRRSCQLIPRFYDPTRGRVLIDGVDVATTSSTGCASRSASCCRTRCCSAARSATTSPMGGPTRRRRRSSRRAKLANADEFIAKMPHGYDSLVGERGLTLSGGQRQRIGIARAIIRNSPILILDEPTAALDTESEKLVMEALERLMKGRTVITIAHRLSTIRDADKIVVLKGGVVAEEGTHDELVARNGIYAELYRIQAGSRLRRPRPPITLTLTKSA